MTWARDGQPQGIQIIASEEKGWPQFRGPRRDGISDEKGLLASWPEGGPKEVWSVEGLGRGYSSPVIVGDRIFITGDVDGEHHVFALDLSGKKIWQVKNGAAWRDPYPGARASVAYSEGRVYHENAHGRLACWDAATGQEIWAVNLLEEFGGKNITWGLSECPVVDEKAVYATAGGSQALAVALDKKTGKVLWKSEPVHDTEGEKAVENPSYVSPQLVRFAGKRLMIGCSQQFVYCLNADNGALQWTWRLPTTYKVIASMPAVIGDAIFATAPHGRDGKLLRLIPPTAAEQRVGVEEVWTSPLDTCQGCVVHVDGKILGSFYPGRKGWGAADAKTGRILYSRSDLVKGAGLYADGHLYALCEDGWMVLLEAGETEFKEKGRFRLADATRRDAWAHPVILDGRLYLRFHEKLHCYDIRAGK